MKTQVPILVLGFKRPDLIKSILTKLEQFSQKNVHVAIDIAHFGSEKQLNAETIQIANEICSRNNWKLTINDLHKGLRKHVLESCSLFFQDYPSGIILEDDIEFNLEFLQFVSKHLEDYEKNQKIMSISGYNEISNSLIGSYSYLTSFSSSWGWATWRVEWEKFIRWLENGKPGLENKVLWKKGGYFGYRRWKDVIERISNKSLDSWAYDWLFYHWVCGKYEIRPSGNLIENKGFDVGATNTFKTKDLFFFKKMLHENKDLNSNYRKFDKLILQNHFHVKSIYHILKNRLAGSP